MAKMKKLENKLTAEIASRKDELVLYGDIIPNPDKVLLTRGRGRNLEIYEDLETDAHVRTVISKRKRAVTSREWFVNEADGSEEATKSAELVRKCLNLINLDRLTEDLLDAVLKGYSVAEIMWGYDENEKIIRPLEIRSRKPQRFIFKQAENDCELRLLTLDSPIDGIEVPERKFIVFTYDRRFDNPYGFGLGNSLFWPVLFKRKGITFWLTFCDKFGSPTSVGKYPASASDSERATLREALEAIANDYGIIVPEGMEVSLLEASKASTDTYEKLARFMDEQISEIVLGETGSTNQSNGGGSRARDQIGNEIRLETAKADADMLCQVLNDSLVRWIIELNMPGAPLKEALLKAGLAKDIRGSFDSEILQPVFSVMASNAKNDALAEFKDIINNTLNGVCATGIDSKILEAAINFFEFQYREGDFGGAPKGLMYEIKAYATWLYDDGNAWDTLKFDKYFKSLREKIGTTYFTDLIKKYLLDNTHASFVVCAPSKTLNEEREAKLKEKLAKFKSTLTKAELEKMIEDTASLKKYQATP
ncbi:MAG: DUF935 family protein, partial [Candidatus Riflebacteria bacterium]|nr:DUF935 family protein [Candidatus Riflebacteria bacterium]